MQTPVKDIARYYSKKETKWGYTLIMHDSKHLGWYPHKKANISEWKAQENYQDKIAECLHLKKEQKVLDGGCGRGVAACYLASKYGVFVTGIDLLEFELAIAKKRAKKLGVEAKTCFQVADYTKTPFQKNSFDAVYANETLCHAPDLNKVFREFFRVLKPGGRLAFFEFVLAEESKFSEEEAKRLDFIIEESAMVGLKQFRPKAVSTILRDAGFSRVSEKDVSDYLKPSFLRLNRIAKSWFPIVKIFGLQKEFINATSAIFLGPLVKRKLFRFYIYSAVKS